MSLSKRRKTSELWNYFTPVNNDVASCNMCKCQLSYKSTTSNLRKHVEVKHPSLQLPKPSTSKQMVTTPHEEPIPGGIVQVGLLPEEQQVDQPSCSAENIADSRGLVAPAESNIGKKRPHQEKISSYLPKKVTVQGKKKIDSSLMKLFTLDFQPFRIVEDEGFREFVHALNPNYELPSRHTISKTSIPAQYEECLNYVKSVIASGKSFCITTDCWTSVNTTSYIAVTTHFVNDDFSLTSVLLECSAMDVEHTSQNLADEILRIVEEWGIRQKIQLAVSDNASNIQGALKNILGFKALGCFAHTLNLLVNDALDVEAVLNLLHKVKTIVGHFRRSTVSNQKLMEFQRNQGAAPLKLIQDVSTRWNSTYYMLGRFVKLETAIRSTVALIDKNLPVLRQDEWKLANQLCTILKPIEAATNTISGEQYCTASLVIPLVNGLEGVIKKMCLKYQTFLTPAVEVVMKLANGLEKRCGHYESSQSLLMSTFLDPRFKHLTFSHSSSTETTKKLVSNAVAEIISKTIEANRPQATECEAVDDHNKGDDEEEDDYRIWSNYEKIIKVNRPKGTPLSRALVEVQRYMDEDVPERKSKALEWWKLNAGMFPYLAELAKEKLCLLATSVPCERLFSKAGLLVTDRRNRLSESKTKSLLFLHNNYKLLPK